MGKKKAQIVEGRTRQERVQVRKKLGTLKNLTVQPRTRIRYQQALDNFHTFLTREGLSLPKKRDHMDGLVSDYLEVLWSDGSSRSEASNFLAGLQDADPKLKRNLPGSWRLMKTWTMNELPSRAPPLSEKVLHAMVGWARFHNHHSFGLSLLVAFYCMLRTGELLLLQSKHIQMSSASSPAVLSLGLTKGGKRQGAAESVTLGEVSVLKALWHWKKQVKPDAFLTRQPHQWRQMFNECLEGLKIAEWGFRPYSLRRGGATFFFAKHGSLDRILLQSKVVGPLRAQRVFTLTLAWPCLLTCVFHLICYDHFGLCIPIPYLYQRLSQLWRAELGDVVRESKTGAGGPFVFRFYALVQFTYTCAWFPTAWRGTERCPNKWGVPGTLPAWREEF